MLGRTIAETAAGGAEQFSASAASWLVLLQQVWVRAWRNYGEAHVEFDPGCTVLVGANGQGKTNLVEAIGYLATLESFRGAPTEALVRTGDDTAIVRGEIASGTRDVLVEAELGRGGRPRVQVNRQRLVRTRDLLGVLRVTVFHPDDLVLVKGGPAERRRFLDDTLAALHPRFDQVRRDLERIVRQRNTLLRQAAGRVAGDVARTLDVWDARLADVGTTLTEARVELAAALAPRLALGYAEVAGAEAPVTLTYDAPWREVGLAAALVSSRPDDVRRGVSLVGPHRDDLTITLNRLAARTHASQGEQRCLALGLRLAAHHVVTDRVGSAPVLVLDDVFSELDAARGAALVSHLPAGQVVLTTAGTLPPGAEPDRVMHIHAGTVHP